MQGQTRFTGLVIVILFILNQTFAVEPSMIERIRSAPRVNIHHGTDDSLRVASLTILKCDEVTS